MHYEEDDHRNHQERWQQGSRNRRPRPENQEHFNDFSSRWNDDVPPLHSTRNDILDERRRFKNDQNGFDQRRPHPNRQDPRDQQRDEYEQWYQNRYRQQHHSGQQQEENYNRNDNQFAKDRWQNDDFLLREEELRRRYNRQFRDWEEEDQRRRRH